MPKRGLPLKACRKCHYLIEEDQPICPICGSNDFSEEWSGLIIILDNNSETSRILNKKELGRYAIEVH